MRAYYCPGTHWDREWYEPFQDPHGWLWNFGRPSDLLEREPTTDVSHGGPGVVLRLSARRPENRDRLVALMHGGAHHRRTLVVLPESG